MAVFIVTRNLHGSWLVSIGSATVWALFYFYQGTRIVNRIAMPIDTWKRLARRFPRGFRVALVDADNIGGGSLNGYALSFALIAREGALSVRVCHVWLLRRNTIAVPWNQIEIRRVGTNSDGNYVATVSFPEFPDCELVLPWLKKFARFHDRA